MPAFAARAFLAFVEGRETPLQMDVLLGFREPPAPSRASEAAPGP